MDIFLFIFLLNKIRSLFKIIGVKALSKQFLIYLAFVPVCFSSPITRRPTFAAWRLAASLSFVCRPCFKLASEMRCKPSGVR